MKLAKFIFFAGVVLFGCVLFAQSKDTGRSRPKRESESLYDNIYSAISEFKASSPWGVIRKFMLEPFRIDSRCSFGNSHHRSCKYLGPSEV